MTEIKTIEDEIKAETEESSNMMSPGGAKAIASLTEPDEDLPPQERPSSGPQSRQPC